MQLTQGNEQKEEHGKGRVIRWRENQIDKTQKAENELSSKIGRPRMGFGKNSLNIRGCHSCINRQSAQLGQGKDHHPRPTQ